MKKWSLIILSLFLSQHLFAQKAYWANKVIEYSSQYGTKEFSAQQVLGAPNALPNYGKSLVAWAPGVKGNKASITVGFEKATHVQQIAIGENLLAGSIESIFLYDEKGKEYLVYHQANPMPKNPDVASMFNHYIPLTPYKVTKLKLELNYKNFRNIPQIDCIGISPDRKKIEAKINTIDYASFIPNPENLGPQVNSRYHDMLPIIAPDDKTLYFARKNAPENTGSEKKDDIYVSYMQSNGTWTKAKNIGAPLNTDEHNFVCAITPDGNTMYLANRYDYRTEGQGVAISYRDKNGRWGKPKPLNIFNMYNKNKYACYHISIDERVMVFAIERDDTYGDMDLYVSFRYADGYWSEPMNMGPDLNTAGAEASVFLAADGKTLYFSSNGHPGYGDLDMFMSKRLDNTWKNWTTPVNLGDRINTPGMDIYYTIPASGEYAYYSSERGGYGRNDIFRVKLPKELRPDAVKINQSGLFTNTEIDIPKLRPYQEAEATEIDRKLKELRSQLNQPTQNTTSPSDNLRDIEKREEEINKDIEELERRYQSIPTPQHSFDYPSAKSISYDASRDNKINDLKRELEKVKLSQPGVAIQAHSPASSTDLKAYEEKLAHYEAQNNNLTNSQTNTADKELTAYEKKLNELLQEQNQEQVEVITPVRISKKKNTPTTDDENALLQSQDGYTVLHNNSLEPNPHLGSYNEKLQALEFAKENQAISNNDLDFILEDTGAIIQELPYTSRLDNSKNQEQESDYLSLDRQLQIKLLEDSIQLLQVQKDEFELERQKQKELLENKEELALTLSQMKIEREQIELEKEKLERERAKLDLLKNQQYRDINALKREIDSLQKIQKTIQPQEDILDSPPLLSIDQELANLKKEVGQKFILKNVYFVANASFIQAKSYPDLDQLAVYLIKNNNINIEVGGHTNGLCDDAYCNQLSNKRAKAVVDYLITKGVPSSILSFKGYGKTQNIADNNTTEARKKNQRVEITITKIQ